MSNQPSEGQLVLVEMHGPNGIGLTDYFFIMEVIKDPRQPGSTQIVCEPLREMSQQDINGIRRSIQQELVPLPAFTVDFLASDLSFDQRSAWKINVGRGGWSLQMQELVPPETRSRSR